MATLIEIATAFCDEIDKAIAHHRNPKTGMQVPYHGNFACVTPSTLFELERWAKQLRESIMKQVNQMEAVTQATREFAEQGRTDEPNVVGVRPKSKVN